MNCAEIRPTITSVGPPTRRHGLRRRSEFFAGSRMALRLIRVDRCEKTRTGVLDAQSCLDRFDLSPGDEGFDETGLAQRALEEETVVMHQAGFRARTRRLAGWRLRTGAEVAHESVESEQRLALGSGFEVPPYGAGLGYLTAGTFVQAQHLRTELGALSLSGGLRLGAFAVLDASLTATGRSPRRPTLRSTGASEGARRPGSASAPAAAHPTCSVLHGRYRLVLPASDGRPRAAVVAHDRAGLQAAHRSVYLSSLCVCAVGR